MNFAMSRFLVTSDADTHISIPVGITIGLLASFVQSLGLTIQRKSHVQNQSLPEDQRKVEHRRPLWLLGFGIFISSNLFGSIVQIASLPVVILAPLGAVSLLWNAFFARILLGDAFSSWMVLGTLLVAGGAILIAVFGIVPEPTRSLEDLLILFSRPTFVLYFSLLGVFVVLSLIATHIADYTYSRQLGTPCATPPLSPRLSANATLLTNATNPAATIEATTLISTERTPLLDRKPSRSPSPSPTASVASSSSSLLPNASRGLVFVAMSYASFSGIISGMCLLFAKSGVELLVLTIGGRNQFWRWEAWVLVLGLIICALLQLWYMHKGLVLANPTLVCPLAFCFYNLSSIINGLVYFDQVSALSTTQLLLVSLGIVVLLAGVWIVSFPPSGGIKVGVGKWDEAEEQAEPLEVFEDEPLPMISQPRPSVEEVIDLSIVRVPDDIEQQRMHASLRVETQHQPPPHLRSHTDPLHAHPLHQSLHEHAVSPPTSPHSSKRPRTISAASPPGGSHQMHRQSFSGYAYPLPPGAAPGTLTGFSIGLSPVSPGFALVPRERSRRRRTTTGPGVGEGENPSETTRFRGHPMKRSVSVGDVSTAGTERHIDSDDEAGEEDRLLGDEEERGRRGGYGDAGSSHGHPGKNEGRPSKSRWKWLRSVFTTKRH